MFVNRKTKLTSVIAAKLFVGLYILFTFISYVFTLSTNYYNGDFLMQKCELGFLPLTVNFVLTILPYFFIFYIYKYFKNKYNPKHCINNFEKIVESFTIVLNFLYIFLVWKYGVGQAFAEVYSAPPATTILIQIILRLYPTTWLGFAFFLSKSKLRTLIYALFIIINAILTQYFGAFLSIIFMMILKYNTYWIPLIKKYSIILMLMVIASSPIVEFGYSIRDSIRGRERDYSDFDNTTLIIGKFFGRLSPFSNTSIILQRDKTYKREAEQLPNDFFINSMLCVVHSSFKIDYSPEKILSGSKVDDYVSFMCGTTGILYMAAYKSWISFVITLLLIIGMDIMVFKLLSIFKFQLKYEVALYLLLQPTMSGVGKEYFAIVWALGVIILICIFAKTTKKLIFRNEKTNKFYNNYPTP